MGILDHFTKYLPPPLRPKRYLLEEYHFDLTAFQGDIGEWLTKYPVNDQYIDIYYAVAELFRRRGEYDKAVTVHEAIAATTLTDHQRADLLLEIAQDYFAAGVLGHAEEAIEQALLLANETQSHRAFRLWLSILESEQDWQRAVQLVEQYGLPGSGGLRVVNLYCEQALALKKLGALDDVKRILKKARKYQLGVRASLLSAELSMQQQRSIEAIHFYRDVLMRDPLRVNSVLPTLQRLSESTQTVSELRSFLMTLYSHHPSVRVLETLIDIGMPEIEGHWGGIITSQAQEGYSLRVFDYWVAQQSDMGLSARQFARKLIAKHDLQTNDFHVCRNCGFQSQTLLWHCPQCESWETIYSDYELKIEQKMNYRR